VQRPVFDTVSEFSAGTFKFKGTHQYVPIFPNFYSKEEVTKISVYFFNKQKRIYSQDKINSTRTNLPQNLRIDFTFRGRPYRADIELASVRAIRYEVGGQSEG